MRKGLPRWLRRALFAEWKKVSVSLAGEGTEREARLAWSNRLLHPKRIDARKSDITSWSELTMGEARYLLRQAREQSGDGPAYRAGLIARLAVELFGADWDAMLRARLLDRFRVPNPQRLLPNEARAEIEELLSRIARRDEIHIETARARLRQKKL